MGFSDAQLGKLIVVLSLLLFVYYTLWLWVPPFISPSTFGTFPTLFPPTRYALIVPALSGMLFIGGLLLFTLNALQNGVTNGGKTSLTFRLRDLLVQHFQSRKQNVKVLTMSQDDYFLKPDDPRHVLLPSLGHLNWDIPSAVDFHALTGDALKIIGDSSEQKEKQLPVTESSTEPLKSRGFLRGILLIEGFLILNYIPTCSLCHLKYYMLLSQAACTARRVTRSYDPPDVPGYFEQCVWPEHVKHRTEILGKGVVIDKSDPLTMNEVKKCTDEGKIEESVMPPDGCEDFYVKVGGNVLPLTNFDAAGLCMVDNIRVLNGNALDKETIAQFVFKDVLKEIENQEDVSKDIPGVSIEK